MLLVGKAIIKRGDTYLTILRAPTAEYFPLHWDFPGGKLEPGEDPFVGIEREVWEEVGLTARALRVAAVYEYDFHDLGEPTNQYTIYETNNPSGEIILSDEHLEYRWVTKQEILKLTIAPFLEDYLNEK